MSILPLSLLDGPKLSDPKPLVIYHGGGCPDGFAAALAAWFFYQGRAEFVGADHGDIHSIDDLPDVTGRAVYILDFSFTADILTASTTLRASIVDMSNAGVSTPDGMAGVWKTYGGVLETELSARAGLVATLVTMLSADVAVASATLDAAWEEQGATGSASTRVQAFTDYRASVETTANIELLTVGGVDDEQAHLILSSMSDISAAAN